MVHIPVTCRIPQDGIRPSEQCSGSVLFSFVGYGIDERTVHPKRLIHESDPDAIGVPKPESLRTRISTARIAAKTSKSQATHSH